MNKFVKILLVLGFILIPVFIGASFFVSDDEQTTNLVDPIYIPNVFKINSDGNVALGTIWNPPIPSHQLSIYGYTSNQFNFGNATTTSFSLYREHSDGHYHFKINEAGSKCFFNGRSDRTDDAWIFSDANVGIGTTNPTSPLYVVGNVSADSFTDRTPFFSGDAVSEIMNIKPDEENNIDHSTIPQFAQKIIEPIIENSSSTEPIKNEIIIERDLGAMISILVKAIQQQQAEINLLKIQKNVDLP